MTFMEFLKNLLNGTTDRRYFFYWTLILIVLTPVLLYIIDFLIEILDSHNQRYEFIFKDIVVRIPFTILSIRRLNHLGKSKWFLLCLFPWHLLNYTSFATAAILIVFYLYLLFKKN